MRVELANGSQIQFQNQYPSSYQPHLLAGSIAHFSTNDWGNIFLQEIHQEKYSIRYAIIDIFKKASLLFFNSTNMVQVSLNLQDSLKLKPKEGKKIILNKGQHSYFENNPSMKFSFEKGKQYKIFETLYHDKTIEEIKTDLAEEGLLFKLLDAPKAKNNQVPGIITPSRIKSIVDEIFLSAPPEELQHFYFRLKVQEILFEILAQNAANPGNTFPLKDSEINSLMRAKELILENISQHKLIPEIARQVHMNEYDLKTGFRKLFNTGIYEMLLTARMEKARKLIIETEIPIKEIALMVGYDRTTSFIRAFRHYYPNTTPSSLRQ